MLRVPPQLYQTHSSPRYYGAVFSIILTILSLSAFIVSMVGGGAWAGSVGLAQSPSSLHVLVASCQCACRHGTTHTHLRRRLYLLHTKPFLMHNAHPTTLLALALTCRPSAANTSGHHRMTGSRSSGSWKGRLPKSWQPWRGTQGAARAGAGGGRWMALAGMRMGMPFIIRVATRETAPRARGGAELGMRWSRCGARSSGGWTAWSSHARAHLGVEHGAVGQMHTPWEYTDAGRDRARRPAVRWCPSCCARACWGSAEMRSIFNMTTIGTL